MSKAVAFAAFRSGNRLGMGASFTAHRDFETASVGSFFPADEAADELRLAMLRVVRRSARELRSRPFDREWGRASANKPP
jgi:hypothetical protein